MATTYMSDRKGHNGITEDGKAATLTAQEKERPIVFDKEMYNCGENCDGSPQAKEDDVAPTVRSDDHPSGVCTSIVRRLTPKECERLQGFPDDWSKYGIDEKDKVYELSDSARYRLQGNSIARPFWTWLLRRIAAQYERPATLGSLFDGQGGFPLCGAESGIRTLWASEIEKHAIAVTRYQLGDK